MLQLRGRQRLAAEPLDERLVARVLRVEDLERDLASELGVLGEVDVGHAADADAPDDLVAAREHLRQRGVTDARRVGRGGLRLIARLAFIIGGNHRRLRDTT